MAQGGGMTANMQEKTTLLRMKQEMVLQIRVVL